MGLPDGGTGTTGGQTTPKIFKALLTMDAYILLGGGREIVTDIQRWLNGRYWTRSAYFIGPCDGHYSRDVQQALMRALQYELGIAEPNGNFGPATKAGLQANPQSVGRSGAITQLFHAACIFNEPVPGTSGVGFRDNYTSATAAFVSAFQRFSALPATGTGDFATWAQLLVSTGDPDRPADACDTRFTITATRASALYSAGYRAVGRYLDEAPGGTLDKEIKPGELETIFRAGLRCFPIWQYNARELADFSYSSGYQHGLLAHDRGVFYGFNRGTVIYFAVDYDATDPEITSNIVPYFHGARGALKSRGSRYLFGVYGSRNVCARVSAEAFVAHSFVSGMSWGFSGNLGFPLADTMRRYHAAAIAPHTEMIKQSVAADYAHRAHRLVTGGVDGLLASMRPLMRWQPPVLEVDYGVDRDLHLDGRGLRLVPSYFCQRLPVSLADPELPPVLVYPVAQQFAWSPATRRLASLDKLLGATRGAVLRTIGSGATTTELARTVNVSLASVSRHTTVLRDAGLVRCDREGSAVLHTFTSLGRALVEAEQGSRAS